MAMATQTKRLVGQIPVSPVVLAATREKRKAQTTIRGNAKTEANLPKKNPRATVPKRMIERGTQRGRSRSGRSLSSMPVRTDIDERARKALRMDR
jgi:hypothetical protein